MGDSHTLDGSHESLWICTTDRTDYDSLDGDREVDVAVVGGGIVGVTAASNLAAAGREVALLEADRILEGTTGHTTAKLTAQHGLKYRSLVSRFGESTARQYARANEWAIEEVAEGVEELDVDADFERRPAVTYAEGGDGHEKVRAEAEVAADLGLPARLVEETDLPFEVGVAVQFDHQAQFHPRKYLLALASSLPAEASVYEETRVTDLALGDQHELETDGGTVRAGAVVLATGFPLVDPAFYFARLRPKRSYVVAARLNEQPPEGMYYRASKPYYSVRAHPSAEGPVVLVGGQSHKTGTGGDTTARYERLQRAVRRDFDVEAVEYRWSTQDYVSVDGLPFVGAVADGCYLATGFGGWGMTNGVAAGRLIADGILDRENPWAGAFDPTRLRPLAGADGLVRYNVGTAKEFVGNWATLRRDEVADLEPGEADVVRRRTSPVAVYRDEDGAVHARSAVCPHMGCLVEWNDAERTWDCPCHGSRFDPDGKVLDGPANDGLDRFG